MQQVDVAARVGREERADVDADGRGAPVAVPEQRAAAAAAEIDDEVVRLGREERAQHVVADFRAEQRRRHAFVTRVGVQRLVQILRLLGELDARTQIEIVARRAVVRAAAAPAAPARPGGPASAPWQSGTAHEREQTVRDHQRSAVTSVEQRFEPLGAAVPGVLRRGVERGARQPARPAPDRRAAAESHPPARRRPRARRAAHRRRRAEPRGSTAGPTRRSARPAAMYSNSFSGEVNRVEIADAGFGSASTVAPPQQFRHACRFDHAGERHAVADAELPRQRLQRVRGRAPPRARRRSGRARPARARAPRAGRPRPSRGRGARRRPRPASATPRRRTPTSAAGEIRDAVGDDGERSRAPDAVPSRSAASAAVIVT